MKDLHGKIAVVTGAASGIGRALAEAFLKEGARVTLADIDADRLRSTETELRTAGGDVHAVATDAADAVSVDRLRQTVLDTWGTVDVVCLNAGVVSRPAPSWEKRAEDWDLVFGVNLHGVVFGIRSFTPLLLEKKSDSHVVITASAAGLIAGPYAADYLASKAGALSLAESLYFELEELAPQVGVSVLCPGFVRTRILDNSRERSAGREVRPELCRQEEEHREMIAESTRPEEIAQVVIEAIRERRLYVFPHPEIGPVFEARLRSILDGENPRRME